MISNPLSIGLPRMHQEPGERRDFLPPFVGRLRKLGFQIVMEEGYGSGMDIDPSSYLETAPSAQFVSHEQTYQQAIVLVLRYPEPASLAQLRQGVCLISMIHLPTRPARIAQLRDLGLEAISLDSVKDDTGRRLVENLHAVAWNGMRAAFRALRMTYPAPGLGSPKRGPVEVTLLGAGAVGMHVVQAATQYGDPETRRELVRAGVPGVRVTTVDYDLTAHEQLMLETLRRTDILVDATQRPDASRPVIPNRWIAAMPHHAVLVDLSVDPYDFDHDPPSVKGIEGIPHGNLDQYVFAPDDPTYDLMPRQVDTTHRRTAVSCYSWPGVEPVACMEVYGRQIEPLMRNIAEAGGVRSLNPQGRFFQRAIGRALLSQWNSSPDVSTA